jgi:hypothetical protein
MVLAEEVTSNTYGYKTQTCVGVVSIDNNNDVAFDGFTTNVAIFR